MPDSALLVLQARFSSTRCPGKVLAPLAGRPLVTHCLARLAAARCGPVVLATSVSPDDDAVAAIGRESGATVCRGPLEDVLARFELAARHWQGPFVLRATGDNPAVDVDGIHRVLQRLSGGADYVVETGLPTGGAVEGVRTDVLRDAARRATAAYDREHVTPFVRNRPEEFAVVLMPAPEALRRPDLRFTVDTPADLDYMQRVFAAAGGEVPSMAALIAAADRVARPGGARA
jgi:spore coat polysaccharide biosynthesis protein SpsF